MNLITKLSIASTVASLLTLGTTGGVQAQTLVAPNNLTNLDGNTNNSIPFSDFGHRSSGRFQQVYASSEFNSLSQPLLITQISFRPDAEHGNLFSVRLPDVQINLSTTKKAPDGLSLSFADNIGVDNTVVYRGALRLSSSFTNSTGNTKDFDIKIELQNPFLYDPALGNLLLDVNNFSLTRTVQFDAEFTKGDSISRVYSNKSLDETWGVADTLGLVTQFTTTSVPEPSFTLLDTLVFGALFGAGSVLKRQQKQQKAASSDLSKS